MSKFDRFLTAVTTAKRIAVTGKKIIKDVNRAHKAIWPTRAKGKIVAATLATLPLVEGARIYERRYRERPVRALGERVGAAAGYQGGDLNRFRKTFVKAYRKTKPGEQFAQVSGKSGQAIRFNRSQSRYGQFDVY